MTGTSTGRTRRHIRKLARQGQHLRMAIDGPTGSGKTFSSILIALHIAESSDRVLCIDTEDGSAGLYAPNFTGGDQINHLIWEPPFDPRELHAEVKDLADSYDVIIIDSLSHFWNDEGGTKAIVDHAAATQTKGNRFAAWQHGTAAQRQLVAAIKRTPAHMIVSMRSKMAYILDEQNRPQKVGLQPEQRDGLEYELDLICDMDLGHNLVVTKTRFSALQGLMLPPGRTVEIAERLTAELEQAEPLATEEQRQEIRRLASLVPVADRSRVKAMAQELFGTSARLTQTQAPECIAWYEQQTEALDEGGVEEDLSQVAGGSDPVGV